jgi:hypothetical protein
MSFGPSSPVTGAPQTGLTSPTYTITSTSGPNAHSEQYAVTALGGTQTGVDTHSVSNPFTLTMELPANFRQIGVPNPVTGVITNVPNNVYKLRVRKGVEPASGQSNRVAMAELKISVPAGADENDAASVRAMLSLLGGALWADSTGIGDVLINGIL